jgi:hypothetical protein
VSEDLARPEQSYLVWRVCVCNLDNEKTLTHWWLLRHGTKKKAVLTRINLHIAVLPFKIHVKKSGFDADAIMPQV